MSMEDTKLTRENFRLMIYYDYASGLTAQQSFERLVSAFHANAPGKSTVYSWFGEFKRGRTNLRQEQGAGRPRTAHTLENILAVQKLIEEDKNISYRKIKKTLGIGASQIQKILHDDLHVKRGKPKSLQKAESKKSKKPPKPPGGHVPLVKPNYTKPEVLWVDDIREAETQIKEEKEELEEY